MIGLALEGGGVKGSYQAGVYQAFLECGIKIDGVCGTSIGAVNAALIASGKGAELANIWRQINVGEVLGISPNLIDILNKKVYNFKTLKLLLKEGLSLTINKGLELQGLRKILDTYLDVNKLLKSKMDFGLVTVKLKNLKPLYLYKEDMNKDKIKDYILASSFLPIFKKEKLIDNNYYIDGGFYDNGPVNMLLNKGYKKVYLVKIHGIGLNKPYKKDADVIVIESKRSLGLTLDINKNRVIENSKMGYYDALRILKNYDGEKYVFKPKDEKYYKYLNRKVSKKEYERVKHFFNSKNYKETTIRATEYIMEQAKINYYSIYKIKKIIKLLQKKYQKDHFIYNYLAKLKYFMI